MKFLFAISFIVLPLAYVNAQNFPANSGARSFGLGNTSVTLNDPYAIINNVAGIAEVTHKSAFVSYDNRFGILELQSVSAGYVHPVNFGVFGIGAFRFGNELFSQQLIGLGYGDKIGIISFGGKINYHQTSIEGFGSKGNVVLEFGANAQVLPEFNFGFSVFNLNQAELINNEQFIETLPTVIQVGISYEPIDDLILNIQVDKDVDLETNFKTGIEFKIIEEVAVRAGFNTEPLTSFFGVGFSKNVFSLDYSARTTQDLGLSHHASISYEFISKKK